MKPRVLFVLKRREDYHQDPSYSEQGISTGLLNSATFVKDMLANAGVESKLVVVVDNNCIDREVHAFKPTHVVIEALWVVPEKFDVLQRLHPKVKWIIRFHSEMPFIAMEGIAMRWLFGYMERKNVYVSANAPRFLNELQAILSAKGYSKEEVERRVVYLPNYYPVDNIVFPRPRKDKSTFNIGCFGAVRPLKNHLIQAVAALKFAEKRKTKLRFHINVGRVEQKGDPILHNLVGLFNNLSEKGHELVMHQWMSHDKFTQVVRQMDIGMQVSFTETFNIVTADLVTNGVPVVLTKEMPWAVTGFSSSVDSDEMACVLEYAWAFRHYNVFANTVGLKKYVDKTERIWVKWFEGTC